VKGQPGDATAGKPFQQRPATLIVARNLTRQQAETLGVSLNERRAGRSAKQVARYGRAYGEAASVDGALETKLGQVVEEQHAATQPAGADHVIRQGDALRLEVARGQGEPVVSQFQVAQDGTATIPGLGSLMCEGLTVDQLHKRLTDNLRESEPAGVERVALSKVVQLRKVTDVQEMTVTPGNATGGAGAGAGGARPTEVAGRGAEDRGALRSRTARSMSAPTAATQEHPTAAAAAPAAPQAKTTAAPGAAEAVKPEAETRGGVAATTQQEPQAGGLTRSQATVAPTTASDAPAAVADAEDRFDVVIVVNDAGSDVADAPLAEVGPSTEPAGPIERFEILTVQVGDNDAGTSNVRVAEDGTVELPNVGRVKAEGLTSAELGAQIADKLKQAATGAAAPNVTVKRVGAADAAAPDGEKVEADNPATSAPAQPAEPSPATPVPTGNSDRIE
jgi:protein involved in polysaccharide export with SLBB domain